MGMIKKQITDIPPVPSLPKTTVSDTPAPGGASPVKATIPVALSSKGFITTEGKTDWAAKDRSIETQAVLKSVLESPAYAQMVVGRREDEAFEIGNRMFQYFLAKFKEAKGA